MSETVQWIIIGALLVLAAILTFGLPFRKKPRQGCRDDRSCPGCALKDKCRPSGNDKPDIR